MRGILLVIIVASGLVVTLRFPFVGILLWQWISLMNPHKLVWGPLMTMPTAAIVDVTTIVSLLASREKKLPPLDGTTILFFLILLWMSVTTLFALAPWALVWDKYDRVWKMILFTLISYTLLTSRRRLEIFTWVVALSIAFFGVKGAIWTLIHGGTGRVYGPEHSMIGDNNDLGLALLLVQPLLFALRANHPKPVVRMALAGIIALNFFGIAFTYSRGALLGAAAIALFLVVKSRNKVGAASALVAVVVAVLVFAPANWYSRMETINSYKSDSSAMGRLYFWRIAIAVAETRPLVGGGFEYMYAPRVINSILAAKSVESLESARTAHSIWLKAWASMAFPVWCCSSPLPSWHGAIAHGSRA